MGKASRTKQDGDRRARIAAQREAERRAEQRKRIYLAGGSILVVAIVVIALVLVKLNSGGGTAAAASNGPTGAALTTLTKQVDRRAAPASPTRSRAAASTRACSSPRRPAPMSVSASGDPASYFATVNGTPLTSGGKPEVLYIGAEYCPYCAAQRWAMVNALSRFGTFTGLTTTHSSSTDADPNTPTWTFYKSTYKSNYINFTSVEETTNDRQGNSSSTSAPYVTLQTPTSAEAALGQAYDPGTGNGGAIPFIDLGNKYVQVGNLSPLSPTLLTGKSWAQVGAAMNDPSSSLGKAIDRQRELHDRGHLQADQQPAGDGLHADDSDAGSQPRQLGLRRTVTERSLETAAMANSKASSGPSAANGRRPAAQRPGAERAVSATPTSAEARRPSRRPIRAGEESSRSRRHGPRASPCGSSS